MNSRRIFLTSQSFIIVIVTIIAIVIVTALSTTMLQQIIGIFYASTLNAILISAIIVGSNRLLHRRLVKVQKL
jgi:hypothetical protein